MRSQISLFAALAALFAASAGAEVVDSAANGFTVRTTIPIQATPDAVYRRLLQVGEWWNSAHSFSGDAKNLSIEEKPGGCFCEKLPNGGAARHMEVAMFAPGKSLVMTGGLGPLLALGATGALSIQLTPADGGTKLQATYVVTGYYAKGLNTIAPPVDGVLAEQFTRLKNLVEQGQPTPKAASKSQQ
jgi:Polyketide cyclase / dehydrase and lipid transport